MYKRQTQTTYPYEISLEVAFRDIDAMGFVNNAVFFAYFETVRIKYPVSYTHLDVYKRQAPASPTSQVGQPAGA